LKVISTRPIAKLHLKFLLDLKSTIAKEEEANLVDS
jgi:hypothetical protein